MNCNSVLLVLALLLTALNSVSLEMKLDDDNNCCQLEWKKLTTKGDQRYLPSSAISVGKTVLGFDIYYFWDTLLYAGVINSTSRGKAFFFAKGYQDWTYGYILSNPNKCVLGWENKSINIATTEHSYPSYSGWRFGKHFDGRNSFYGYHQFESIPKYLYSLNMDTGAFKEFDYSLTFLYVDCRASLNKQVLSELVDIKFDLGEKSREANEKIIASREIINNSDQERNFTVELAAEIFSSLDLYHQTNLNKLLETKWGVSSHPSDSFVLIEDFLDSLPSSSRKKGYDPCKLKEEFVRTGKLSIKSKKFVFKFHQVVQVKAKSIAKVVIKTKPIEGNQDLRATYRIRPKYRTKMWTEERLKRAMERMGFEDLEGLRVTIEELIVAYKGRLSIKTAIGTQALIVTRPLDSEASTVVFKKTLTPRNVE